MAIVAPEEIPSKSITKGVYLPKKLCIFISIMTFLVVVGVILGLSIGLTRSHEPQCTHKFDSCNCSILRGKN